MNAFIKALRQNTRNEGWNAQGQTRYPDSEYDAFEASESNQFYCYGLGIYPSFVAMSHHKSIWRAHKLADRCFRHSDKYFKHPTGRSYFNPWYRRAHQKRVDMFYERLMIRELDRLLTKQKGA